MRILVVEDYLPLQEAVTTGLREAGYAVDVTGDGEEGLWYATSNDYDVIVLDLMLPKVDGLTVLRRLRAEGRSSQVLILTAKDTVPDRVRGLNFGADDYLVKPFAFEELLARVRALARRAYAAKNPLIEIDDLRIDTPAQRVWRGKEEVSLTPREYALLEYLAVRTGEVVSRTDIWNHLYEFDSEVDSNVVDVYILYLRKKIERPGKTVLIHTMRGRGYRLGGNPMIRSLKWRLLIWTAGGMLLLIAVFAVILYMAVERTLVRGFESGLEVTARALATSVDFKKGRLSVEDTDLPEFRRLQHPDYYEIRRTDGSVALRSPSLGKADLPASKADEGSPVFIPVTLPNQRPGRAIAMTFRPRAEDEDEEDAPAASVPLVVLVVARETRHMDEQLEALRWQLAGAGGATVLLTLLVAALVVRQGMRPVGTMAGRIAAIRENDLSDRIPTDSLPTEMASVALRINELLGRLDEAFRRERTLTADVAHELRTPLAGLLSTIEVALSRPRSSEEQTRYFRTCLGIVRQTKAMTDNLLALARIEGSQVTPQRQTVSLGEMVDALWQPYVQVAQTRRITFTNAVSQGLECATDRDLLVMAFSNILSNAAEYTDDDGRIEVSGQARTGAVELVFSNTGCTLAPDQAGHVFDRFWRGDTSRTATGVHCGLGLSLVERAIHILGGSVTAAARDGRFIVCVMIPVD
jgi:heavy metal sensor kinase